MDLERIYCTIVGSYQSVWVGVRVRPTDKTEMIATFRRTSEITDIVLF